MEVREANLIRSRSISVRVLARNTRPELTHFGRGTTSGAAD